MPDRLKVHNRKSEIDLNIYWALVSNKGGISSKRKREANQ
jgi:hypothetical protein